MEKVLRDRLLKILISFREIMTEEFPEISLLYSEPGILLRVFLMLDLEDLTVIEDVCKYWREFGKSEIDTYFLNFLLSILLI